MSRRLTAAMIAIALLGPSTALAQTAPPPSSGLRRSVTFLAGTAAGLAIHESGHAVFAGAFGANPRITRTTGGPVPFFAIYHDPVSRGREYVVSSAGLWFQNAVAEVILTSHPQLRHEDRPFMKGIVFFHFGVSAIYGVAAFARVGPDQRDTRGMAVSLGRDGVPEPAIGALVLAPAALDAYRYWKPGSKWAPWASRAAKITSGLLAINAGRGR